MGWLPFTSPASAGERTVWVSRHGRTDANEAHIIQGWEFHELSETGRAETAQAAQWWAAIPVDRVIASPLRRTLQTADLIFGRVDDIDAGWAEQAAPALTGLSAAQAHQARPDLCRPDGWPRIDAPRDRAQEHMDTVTARALGSLLAAAAALPAGSNVAVVTHGAVLLALLRAAGDESASVGNLEVGQFVVDPARGWTLAGRHSPLTT